MYSRTTDAGAVRTFGVSGRLWHGVLVMYDRETDSLWTQLDGRAIRGPAEGERLEHVASTYTTWSAWRAAHPETLALEKGADERELGESRYAAYRADPDYLFFDHLDEGLGGLRAKDLVYGIALGERALAISADLLAADGVVNAVVGDVPVAWLLDRRTGFPIAVDRRCGDRVRVLAPDGDRNPAEQVRDAASGEPVDPAELERLRLDRAFWFAWRRSHPESRVLIR